MTEPPFHLSVTQKHQAVLWCKRYRLAFGKEPRKDFSSARQWLLYLQKALSNKSIDV